MQLLGTWVRFYSLHKPVPNIEKESSIQGLGLLQPNH